MRYTRLPFSPLEHACLQTSRILLVGAGAVGANVAAILARFGVATKSPGMLYVIDGDRVEEENLATQPYLPEHTGLPKVDALKKLLLGIQPQMNATFWKKELNESDISRVVEISQTVDIVVFAIDSFPLLFRLSAVIEAPQVAAFLGPRGGEAEVAFAVPQATPPLRETLARPGGLSRLSGESTLPTRVLAVAAYASDMVIELLLSGLERSERHSESVSLYADCPLHIVGFERTGIFANRPRHETRSVVMAQHK